MESRAAAQSMNVLVAGFITIDRIELSMRHITSIGGPPVLCRHSSAPGSGSTSWPSDEGRARLPRRTASLARPQRAPAPRHRQEPHEEDDTVQAGQQWDGETASTSSRGATTLAQSRCPDKQFSASLISPLAHEISTQVFDEVRKRSDFCFLDPQGFVRMFDGSGKVTIDSWSDERILGNVDALKMDLEEANALTGTYDGKAALVKLSKRVRKAVVTRGSDPALVLEGNKVLADRCPEGQGRRHHRSGRHLRRRPHQLLPEVARLPLVMLLRHRGFFDVLELDRARKIDLPRSVDQQARKLYSSATTVETI